MTETYVYFLKSENNLVKIGKAIHLEYRISELKRINAVKLTLLCYSDKINETEVHNKFKHLKNHNEWYYLSDEILDYIERIKSGKFDDQVRFE